MAGVRHHEFFYIFLAFAAYFVLQIISPISNGECGRSYFLQSADFENDVALEFEKFGFACGKNTSRCVNGEVKNSTRIVVNGKVWNEPLDADALFPNLNGIEGQKENTQEGLKHGPKLVLDHVSDIIEGRNVPLMSCEEMKNLFRPKDVNVDVADGGIIEIRGFVDHPVIGETSCVLRKALSTSALEYEKLKKEREKRIILGSETRVTNRILGECVTSDVVSLIVELDETETQLCEDDDNPANYAYSKCLRNEKLRSLIDKSPDKTRAAFSFIKELLCVFAEIEKKHFFAHDIHGKHLSVSSDFSVRFNNVDNLSHHGSRNILSGSTCKYDENCPSPAGALWVNGSANRVVYEKCKDPIPLCADTRCAGYNSSLHMCGIARWILQPLYSYFERLQDRSRMTSIMMSSMNSWPFLRRPAVDSCKKAIVYLGLYDKDMKLGKDVKGQSKNFHVGKPK